MLNSWTRAINTVPGNFQISEGYLLTMGLLCDSGLQLWVMSNGFDLLGKLSDVLCQIWLPVGTIILYRMWFQLFLIKRKRRNNSKTLFLCTFRVVAMFLAFVLTQLRGYKKQQKKFKVCKRWYILQHALMRFLDEIPWSPNWHPVYSSICIFKLW